jgi:hypothetical protein
MSIEISLYDKIKIVINHLYFSLTSETGDIRRGILERRSAFIESEINKLIEEDTKITNELNSMSDKKE